MPSLYTTHNKKVFKVHHPPVRVMETVTIPKEEYERLKRGAEVDEELVAKIKKSLEDLKSGRVREWKG